MRTFRVTAIIEMDNDAIDLTTEPNTDICIMPRDWDGDIGDYTTEILSCEEL